MMWRQLLIICRIIFAGKCVQINWQKHLSSCELRALNLFSLSVAVQVWWVGEGLHSAVCLSRPYGGNAPFVKWPSVIVTAERGQSGRREESETQPSLSEAVMDKQVRASASAARSPLQTSHTNQENTHTAGPTCSCETQNHHFNMHEDINCWYVFLKLEIKHSLISQKTERDTLRV